MTDTADRPSTADAPSALPSRRGLRTLVAAALGAGVLVAGVPVADAAPVPAYPSGLPTGVEAFQPYVGQGGCDPVAKPGVRAFSSMLMSTYRDSGSLGIVRDCGIGGASEHKEGRAFDWAVSAYNANHVAEVKALTDWLTASKGGYAAANARRFGIMYMIWNRKIWKAYQADRGWQPYSGASPHTDHVHFSFGWAGAKQNTSWWSKRVAPIDYGPYVKPPSSPTPPPPPPVSAVQPASPANLKVLATYGATTVAQQTPTTYSDAAQVVQRALGVEADGYYGAGTATAVRAWQAGRRLPATGAFGPADWKVMFPRPTVPFGTFESLTPYRVKGWAADADTTAPIDVQVLVDKVPVLTAKADRSRPELATSFPGVGTAHGYDLPVQMSPGTHSVCVVGVNVGAGANTSTGCANVTVVAPSPLTAAANRQDTFLLSRSASSSVVVREVTDSGIGGPTDLGGKIVGAPAGVARWSGALEVVARGTDNDLWTRTRLADGTFTPYRRLAGPVSSRPSLSARGDGRVDLVARATDGRLLHRMSSTPGAWSGWVSLGGKLLEGTAPAVAWTPSGRLDVYGVGTDRAAWRRSRTGSGSWTEWQKVGGGTRNDLTAVATGTSEVTVAARGTDNAGWALTVPSSTSTGRWTRLGGTLAEAPAVVAAPRSTRPIVIGTGTDGNLWATERRADRTWTGWSRQD